MEMTNETVKKLDDIASTPKFIPEKSSLKNKLSDLYKKSVIYGTIATNVLLWSGIGLETGFVAKNIYQHENNVKQNLEYKISESDYKQMNHLSSFLEGPVDDFSEFEVLENLVPSESMGIALGFMSYAMTNIALTDPSKKEEATEHIDKAIQKMMADKIKTPFFEEFGNPFEKGAEPEGNVLYLGHLNLMLGSYQLVSGNDKYSEIHERITDLLSKNFIKSETHHLESYPTHKWPADNTVALASLDLYDKLNGTDHSEAIKLWKEWTLENMLDDNGLLYSHIDTSNRHDEEARGCALGYSMIFINMFDPEFSAELYSNFKKNFYKEIAGIKFAKEWEDGDNYMTVDTGPIINGAGTVASAFAIGASKLHGDEEQFATLSLAAELVTLPYETLTEKGYLANVSLGEAILLYGRTARPWL